MLQALRHFLPRSSPRLPQVQIEAPELKRGQFDAIWSVENMQQLARFLVVKQGAVWKNQVLSIFLSHLAWQGQVHFYWNDETIMKQSVVIVSNL